MIFVTVGSQKFQFNRLLKKIDELISNKLIKDRVFAQIGVSDYKPQHYEYVDFMTQDTFNKKIDECNLVITHAGTGVIVNAIKKGKKVIAVPRLAQYAEHVDDHQIQLIQQFNDLKLIEPCYNIDELGKIIEIVKNKKYNKYVSNVDEIIESIEEYLNS